jgi:hypothetical protein
MEFLVSNHTRSVVYCRPSDGLIIDQNDIIKNLELPTAWDLDNHLSNGLFTLRRPGSYLPIAGLCALPPRSAWLVCRDGYRFSHNIRAPASRLNSIEAAFRYARGYVQKARQNNNIAVELSGGLDSSIIIEFFLMHELPISLIGFTSNSYEFRTERAIQSYYEKRCESVELIPYEHCSAFSELDKIPAHPTPAQESLFFARHSAAAKACKDLSITTLLSGEAGDQLLGFPPDPCDAFGRAPPGYAYWNLAELWSNQYVYEPQEVSYVSALALGGLPAILLQARLGMRSDHMKKWARQKLRGFLPEMLTGFAYKAFHDGWVIDGLIKASPTIFKISKLSHEITGHKSLRPNVMVDEAKNYRLFDEKKRTHFLSKLCFAAWIYSLHGTS